MVLVPFGAKVELYAGQLLTVRGSALLCLSRSVLLDARRRTGAAPVTGIPGPLYRTVRWTVFGDTVMSKVMRCLDPSSPVIKTACIADVSFGIGAASVAPESTHFRSFALYSITWVLEVLPPTITASPADQGNRIGLSDTGTIAESTAATPCGADAPMVKVSCVAAPEPSWAPAKTRIESVLLM